MMEHIEAALTRDGMASLLQAVASVLNASQWQHLAVETQHDAQSR
jgi:hypothetical protein